MSSIRLFFKTKSYLLLLLVFLAELCLCWYIAKYIKEHFEDEIIFYQNYVNEEHNNLFGEQKVSIESTNKLVCKVVNSSANINIVNGTSASNNSEFKDFNVSSVAVTNDKTLGSVKVDHNSATQYGGYYYETPKEEQNRYINQ